jgi:hypothetical protein
VIDAHQMKPVSFLLRAAWACAMTLGAAVAVFAFVVSGGPPKDYEVRAMREALGSAYVKTLESVEHGARRLRDGYCAGTSDPDCAVSS